MATKERSSAQEPAQPLTDEQIVAEQHQRDAEKAAQAEKEGKVTGESGKRDISAEQETTTKSAQELVQERHMNPDAFEQ